MREIATKEDEQNEQELELQEVLRVCPGCKRSREDDNGVDVSSTPTATPRKRYKILRP